MDSQAHSRAPFVAVCDADELGPDSQRMVQVDDHPILLCRAGNHLHAIQASCPHAWQPLLGGRMRDGFIQCPKHGARFELATGRPLNGVTTASLLTYPVREEAGKVLIDAGGDRVPRS